MTRKSAAIKTLSALIAVIALLALHAVFSFKPSVVVFEGDSLSTAENPITYWPKLIQFQSSWKQTEWHRVAIGATTAIDMVARYNTNIHPYRPKRGVGLLTIYGGTNDIRQPRAAIPVEQTYDRLKQEWAQARADGFEVIAFTIHSTAVEEPCLPCDAQGLQLNALIRSDPSLYDRLVETDKVFPDRDDAHLLYDKVHFTPAGNARMAEAVRETIAGMWFPRTWFEVKIRLKHTFR